MEANTNIVVNVTYPGDILAADPAWVVSGHMAQLSFALTELQPGVYAVQGSLRNPLSVTVLVLGGAIVLTLIIAGMSIYRSKWR
jgi:hypothetical protein